MLKCKETQRKLGNILTISGYTQKKNQPARQQIDISRLEN
jgi:hypothetical protein